MDDRRPASPPRAPALASPDEFHRVFERHRGDVYAAAYSVLRDATEAQDVVQDVFLRLWARPQAFDPRRGDLVPYLRLLGRSRALDRRRRARTASDAAARLERLFATAPPEDGPSRAAERSATARDVRRGLHRLPPPQREAVVLNHLVGRSGGLGMGRLRTDPDLRAAA